MDKTHYKELIEKYFEETITDVEIKELSDWIKNDRQLHDWWEQEFERSDSSMNPVLRDKLFARIKEETLGKEVRPLRIIPWKWVAAILLPVCVAFFTYYLLDSSPTAETPFIVKAGKGDKATIELPDGTNVVLNSASQLSYLNNFGEKVRRVQLNGEAYFKVAHDEKHAFIVQIGDLEVKVLGTSFNVSAYKNDKQQFVALATGSVAVKVTNKKNATTMKPNQLYTLEKNTFATKVEDADIYEYICWKDGFLIFRNESLADVLKKIERYYNVVLTFDPAEVSKVTVSGKLDFKSDIRETFRIISITAPIVYEKEGDVIKISVKQ
mgnify:CR=1 FL=1